MDDNSDDICPRPARLPQQTTSPHTAPIWLSSVYECSDPTQAETLLAGEAPGYVYARDGHPNADLLAEKCRQLHGTERAAIAGSGMGAMAVLLLAQAAPGDHLIVSNQLYGRSLTLLNGEAGRLGITCSVIDTCDLAAVRAAFTPRTKLVVVETISNPLLRVADLTALSKLAHEHHAALMVDNTLAGPLVCRPAEFGADWIVESITKSMNGHSDVVLGLLCGPAGSWQRVPGVLSTWGLASAPFDCWLAARGMSTMAVRVEQACKNAQAVAQHLATKTDRIAAVHYPGLAQHVDHALAQRQFGERLGSMVTFTLHGGREAATAFIAAARQIPFCPSLGELNTTLSHPASTSHRTITAAARQALGITEGTIRLSVGIESTPSILQALDEGLE